MANSFLANLSTSALFATILVEYLLERLPEMGSNVELSNLYLKLFKLVFGSVSLFAAENEQMLKVSGDVFVRLVLVFIFVSLECDLEIFFFPCFPLCAASPSLSPQPSCCLCQSSVALKCFVFSSLRQLSCPAMISDLGLTRKGHM